MRIVHFSPHPDDEILGAGATLIKMQREGHEVINVACSLGRPEQRVRRQKELTESCRRAAFELVLPTNPIAMSSRDDLVAAERQLTEMAKTIIDHYLPDLIVGPSPHDSHPGHEVVGRAVFAAADATEYPSALWLWEFWSRLAHPTLLVPVDAKTIETATHAVSAHHGENERADYTTMLRSRSQLASRAGFERVFGFGSTVDLSVPYAEELCELVKCGGGWHFGKARTYGSVAAIGEPSPMAADWWMRQTSMRSRFNGFESSKADQALGGL